jgi:hypothetical protein
MVGSINRYSQIPDEIVVARIHSEIVEVRRYRDSFECLDKATRVTSPRYPVYFG